MPDARHDPMSRERDTPVPPRGQPRSHELHAQRSLAYHRLVADQLRLDPTLLERGRARVTGWITGRLSFAGSKAYAVAWQKLLFQSLEQIIDKITSEDADARELRQTSPFNGMLGQETWLQIVKAIKEPFSSP